MNYKSIYILLCCWLGFGMATADPLGTAFSYQGELKQSGQPANGAFDLEFRIYDALTAGTELAPSVILDEVNVAGGIFSVQLDFGDTPFAGDAVWLEVHVRPGASSGAFTALAPRQAVHPAPYALHAQFIGMDAVTSASVADNTISAIDLASNSVGSSEIQFSSVGANHIASNAVGSSEIASNAVGLSEADTNVLQARISGTCADGAMREVHADGSVDCVEISRLASGLVPSQHLGSVTIDSSTGTGVWPDMELGADGNPVIAHFDATNGDLKLSSCLDPDCNSVHTEVVDATGIVGDFPSLEINTIGNPLISYYDATNQQLKYAFCEDSMCTSAIINVVDSNGSVGQYSDLFRLGSRVMISYYDSSNGNLKLARCNDEGCSSPTIVTADNSAADVGRYSSIGFGTKASSRVLIAYHDATNGALKTVVCTNAATPTCLTPETEDDTSSNNGLYPDVITAANGAPIVAYATQSALKLLVCTSGSSTDPCTARTLIGPVAQCGGSCQPYVLDAALDTAGFPVVITQNGTMLRCGDTHCTTHTGRISTHSGPGSQEKGVSLLIRDNGTPLWARQRFNNLRLASCRNRFCRNGSID